MLKLSAKCVSEQRVQNARLAGTSSVSQNISPSKLDRNSLLELHTKSYQPELFTPGVKLICVAL
jgi:hypothetical protein